MGRVRPPAPCSISPRYSASDSSVSQFAMTPSATSAAVPTIFGPRPAGQMGGTPSPIGPSRRWTSCGLNHLPWTMRVLRAQLPPMSGKGERLRRAIEPGALVGVKLNQGGLAGGCRSCFLGSSRTAAHIW